MFAATGPPLNEIEEKFTEVRRMVMEDRSSRRLYINWVNDKPLYDQRGLVLFKLDGEVWRQPEDETRRGVTEMWSDHLFPILPAHLIELDSEDIAAAIIDQVLLWLGAHPTEFHEFLPQGIRQVDSGWKEEDGKIVWSSRGQYINIQTTNIYAPEDRLMVTWLN